MANIYYKGRKIRSVKWCLIWYGFKRWEYNKWLKEHGYHSDASTRSSKEEVNRRITAFLDDKLKDKK